MFDRKIKNIINAVKLITDTVLLYIAFLIAYKLRFEYTFIPVIKGIPSLAVYKSIIPVVVAIWVMMYIHYGFYGRKNSGDVYDEFFNVVRANVFSSMIVMALTFLYRDFSYSRLVLVYAGVVGSILVLFSHELLKFIEKRMNICKGGKYRVLVVGTGKPAEMIDSILKKKQDVELYKIDEIKKAGFKEYLVQKGVKEIIVAKSPVKHEEVLKLVDVCEALKIKLKVLPDILELRLGSILMDEYYGLPVLQIKPMDLSKFNLFFKRVMDVVISILIIAVMFIPLLIVSILLKLDSSGPVFHRQFRMGYKGKEFPFLKFRSMVVNADDLLKGLIHLNERKGPVFKMRDDPRVTRVGKFLRRYSIDEMPQLYNILRGDMSIVGPRPQVLWEASYYDDWAKKRLRVLPGITGYWQISGRSDLSYEDMIRLDIYYIENWNFELDFKIIMKTVPAVFSKTGAY